MMLKMPNGELLDEQQLAKWHWIKPLDLILGVNAKCGTQTLLNAVIRRFFPEFPADWNAGQATRYRLDTFEVLTPAQARQVKTARRVGVIREPVSRFWSLWRNKIRDGRQGSYLHAGVPPQLWGVSPTELLDYIERYPYGNAHWRPQHLVLQDIWQELVPLPQLSAWFAENYNWELRKHNVTQKEPHKDYATLLGRIKDMYAEDLSLYQSTGGVCQDA